MRALASLVLLLILSGCIMQRIGGSKTGEPEEVEIAGRGADEHQMTRDNGSSGGISPTCAGPRCPKPIEGGENEYSEDETACHTDEDCGGRETSVELFCIGYDQYVRYEVSGCQRHYACGPPRSGESRCTTRKREFKVQTCESICLEGSCLRNPGNPDLLCTRDTDCGGGITNTVCTGECELTSEHFLFECENPGTRESQCKPTTWIITQTPCPKGCENNRCK
ncbi:MAG: hypothetical protein GF416_02750 [Candidatus Altiarchaeales archaeon]|nr:hypothetical protein [Candidatus Altiarchaeales archaeon]MBD3416038.1 hypothetical protein [Candidatus Altiarchaeales archaeon]